MAMRDLVAAGRGLAESLMTDECAVTRAGAGDPVFDPETGRYTDPAPVVVYEGPCRVRATDSVTRDVVSGEGELGVLRRSLRVPVNAATQGVARGDTVTVTVSDNAGLVGVVFTVTATFDDTHGTARRLQVEGVV